MFSNISTLDKPEEHVAQVLSAVAQPARIRILMVISVEEACVCHFESVLGMRQASISQHLMVLKKAGLVSFYRDGRNIFYKLNNNEIIPILLQVTRSIGINSVSLEKLTIRPVPGCLCPRCNPDLCTNNSCRNNRIPIQT